MLASEAATLSMSSKSSCIFLLLPMMLANLNLSCSFCLSCRFSVCRSFRSIAFSSSVSRLSESIGFSRKYDAPALMADTAFEMVPWPEMTTTSVSGWLSLKRCSRSIPSTSGSTMSVTATSGRQLRKISSPRAPIRAVRTS